MSEFLSGLPLSQSQTSHCWTRNFIESDYSVRIILDTVCLYELCKTRLLNVLPPAATRHIAKRLTAFKWTDPFYTDKTSTVLIYFSWEKLPKQIVEQIDHNDQAPNFSVSIRIAVPRKKRLSCLFVTLDFWMFFSDKAQDKYKKWDPSDLCYGCNEEI